MSDRTIDIRIAGIIAVTTLLAGCASQSDPLANVRARMAAAGADDGIRVHAAGSLADAQRTLALARDAGDEEQRDHLIYLTEKNLDIAGAIVARRQAEQELNALRQRQTATREAPPARPPAPGTVEARPLGDGNPPAPETAARDAREAPVAARPAPEPQTPADPGRNTVLTIPDLSFDNGTANLSPDAQQRLDELVRSLRADAGLRALIAGHSDNVGSREANLQMSLKRAKSVKAYLLEQGIAADRVQTLGQGAEHPIASNETPEGRWRNRRAEIALYRVPNPTNEDARRP